MPTKYEANAISSLDNVKLVGLNSLTRPSNGVLGHSIHCLLLLPLFV